MRIDLESILIHADRRLAGQGPDRAAWLEAGRSFLKVETERLRIRHRLGAGGGEVTAARSYAVDLLVRHAWQRAAPTASPEAEDCALVALGGYGRGELAPGSDIDLLFLFPGREEPETARQVEEALKLLWDVGLRVGHSFRSMGECVSMAREDLHSRNAMADGRLLWGSGVLFSRLCRGLERGVYRKDRETDAFIEATRLEQQERYAKFGRVVCLQEPNVKESAGGLRDLHTVLWVGQARYGCRGLEGLRASDWISGQEYTAARRAYDFLCRVRNEAHFSTGRAADLLTLELQPTLAANLGYEPRRGMEASEIFMRDYYRRAQALHAICDGFLVRACAGRKHPYLRPRSRRVGPRGSLEVREGRLHAADGGDGLFDGLPQILEAFAVAQEEGVPLGDDLRLAVRARLHLVDRRARASPDAGGAFLEILRQPRAAATLRLMHESGLLGRVLPEFRRITFLVQHDHYHKYTVDEHTLKALEALDEVVEGRPRALARFHEVFRELEDPALLYLGLLLHDIGKGRREGGHSARGARIAEGVCRRLGLDRRQADDVVFLVRQHLVMSQLSQRRDLSEARLVEGFAQEVGTLERLNQLLLLTYADHCGVGPGIWNDWKATLLWELYGRTRARLTGQPARPWERQGRSRSRQRIVRALAADFPVSEVERHLALLPERYLRTTEPARVEDHFRLVQRLGRAAMVAEWREVEDRHHSELTVCTRDAPGLLARLAGTLTAQAINILSVELYTREDGLVLDTFRLSEVGSPRPVDATRWKGVEQALEAALEGRTDVAQAIEWWRAKSRSRPKRRRLLAPMVRFDGDVSASATVVEVRAEDEPGLVYRIAATLAALGLDISFAKIATEKSQALDVFYVTDTAGNKLAPARLAAVERALLEALGAPPHAAIS
jgi:[protein-PII] uridylyltransferase